MRASDDPVNKPCAYGNISDNHRWYNDDCGTLLMGLCQIYTGQSFVQVLYFISQQILYRPLYMYTLL